MKEDFEPYSLVEKMMMHPNMIEAREKMYHEGRAALSNEEVYKLGWNDAGDAITLEVDYLEEEKGRDLYLPEMIRVIKNTKPIFFGGEYKRGWNDFCRGIRERIKCLNKKNF